MQKFYRAILSQSWQLTKKYKWLWWFGFFASLISSTGEIDALMQNQNLANAPQFLNQLKDSVVNWEITSIFGGIGQSFAAAPLATTIALLIFLGLIFLFIWLGVTSQGALIEAAARFYNKQKLDFSTCFAKGKEKFWSLFGLNIVINFILYFALIVLALPFAVIYLATNSTAAIVVLTILAFIILTPIAIILAFVLKYAFSYIIIDNESAWLAFVRAWKLFVNNWLISIEMAFIIFIINLLVGFSLVFGLLVLSLPFAAMIVVATAIGNTALFNLALATAIILLALIILFTAGILTTFQYSSWTILFMEIKSKKVHPKLIRILHNKINK